MRKNLLILTLFGLAAPAAGVNAEDNIDFGSDIYPFVKSGCVKCHSPAYEDERGRTRKPKADIVLATKDGLLAEYELDSGDTKALIIPGKPDESRMLEVTLLPLYDDLHFPPEGKAPQWTDAEKDLFAKWVEQGAEFGDWEADPTPQEGLDWDGKEKASDELEKFE
ncbi:MAG: hypothetical protein AAGC68_06070 [Verrucomicrobiota bacterium]